VKLALLCHIVFICCLKVEERYSEICFLCSTFTVGFAFLTFFRGGTTKHMKLTPDYKAHSGSERYPLMTFDKKAREEGSSSYIYYFFK